MSVMEKLNKLYKELGGVDCGWYLIKKLLAVLSPAMSLNRYKLLAQEVNGGLSLNRIHESITIKQVQKSEYKVDWFLRPAEVIRSRFAQHAVCFVAFKNNQPVGCLWLVLGPYNEDEVRCRFVPQPCESAAWDFDIYIRPEYRLSRMFIYLWNEANQYMYLNGIKWTMSRIDAFNTQSVRSHKRMGAICMGGVTFIRYAKLQIMISSIYPFFHVSLRESKYPVVKLFAPRDVKLK